MFVNLHDDLSIINSKFEDLVIEKLLRLNLVENVLIGGERFS